MGICRQEPISEVAAVSPACPHPTPLPVATCLHFHHVRGEDALQHQLRNAIALFDWEKWKRVGAPVNPGEYSVVGGTRPAARTLKVRLGQVEQHHAHAAAVVGVNHARCSGTREKLKSAARQRLARSGAQLSLTAHVNVVLRRQARPRRWTTGKDGQSGYSPSGRYGRYAAHAPTRP